MVFDDDVDVFQKNPPSVRDTSKAVITVRFTAMPFLVGLFAVLSMGIAINHSNRQPKRGQAALVSLPHPACKRCSSRCHCALGDSFGQVVCCQLSSVGPV